MKAKAYSANITLARHSFGLFFHHVFGLEDGPHQKTKGLESVPVSEVTNELGLCLVPLNGQSGGGHVP